MIYNAVSLDFARVTSVVFKDVAVRINAYKRLLVESKNDLYSQ